MLQQKNELIISFFTGGTIMATELVAAKMLEPPFGSSIYLWSSILGFTMLGLAFGYLLGGRISKKNNPSKKLLIVLLLISFSLFLFPIIFRFFVGLTNNLNLKSAIAITSFFIIFPPLMLLGMCSPLIIRIININVNQSGLSSGNVFSISTLGGIIFTIASGLFLIPNYGSNFTLNLLSLLMLLCVIYYYFFRSKIK